MLNLDSARKAILGRQEGARKPLLICGLLVTALMAVLYCFEPTFFRFLDNKTYDTFARATGTGHVNEGPVIVDLDEKSLSRFGQWPWPRYRLAMLLEKLSAAGASVIALDMVFAERDRMSLDVLRKDIFRDMNVQINAGAIPEQVVDNDKILANTLSKGPFVLAYRFGFSRERDPGKECMLHPARTVIVQKGRTPEQGSPFFQPQNVVCNLGILSGAVRSSGIMNGLPDPDGVVRRAPLLMQYKGRRYPSLPLAASILALNIRKITLNVTARGAESLSLDDRAIPLDAKGNMLIRYYGRGRTFTYISAGDVLSGLVPSEEIKGKIVFLGTSATGLEESRPTPLDPAFPGPEVHATLAQNIMRKEFFLRPYWAPGVELLLLCTAGIVSTLFLTLTGALWSLILLTLGASGLWQGAHWLLDTEGIFLSPLFPMITMGGNFGVLVLLKYRHEEQLTKARTKELLQVQDFTILCLTSLTETRDSETGGHILRTQRYIKSLCKHLSTKPGFRRSMNPDTIEHIHKSAPLHDIGKVGVPDQILRKPTKLSDQEFEEIKKHTIYGRDAIERAELQCAARTSTSFLRTAKEMVYTHHERWDGKGYPNGLKGEEIPLSGRIMAIVDVYDALISSRVYRPSLSHEEAVALITEWKGTHFDPGLVEAFLEVHEEFKAINKEFTTEQEEPRSSLLPPGSP